MGNISVSVIGNHGQELTCSAVGMLLTQTQWSITMQLTFFFLLLKIIVKIQAQVQV